MKISLDIDTYEFTIPYEFFEKLNADNEFIEKHNGTPISVEERIRIAFDIALSKKKTYNIEY